MYLCSHGEALTFEPLLVENREESFLRDMSVVAVATVTQVLVLVIQPELKGLISLPLRVRKHDGCGFMWLMM